MLEPNFDLEGITFRTTSASGVHHPEWRAVQELERRAFTDGLERSREEVEYMLDWSNPLRFSDERIHPMKAVERGRLRENQLLLRPRVTRAFDGEKVVGYVNHMKNTSGSPAAVRWLKMGIPGYNYEVVREIAVDPNYQHRGLGVTLGYLALEKVGPGIAYSGYIWKECPALLRSVVSLGARVTDEETVEQAVSRPLKSRTFGPGAEVAPLIRVEGDPRELKARIEAMPGAREAIDYAHAHTA